MAEFDPKRPQPPELGMAAYSQQFYDSPAYQDRLKQHERDLDRYERNEEREADLRQRAKEKEADRIEKEADKKSDRRFLWIVTLLSAVIGAIIGSVVTIIYEVFFK